MPAFVAYFRVSTDKQGASGLGLEAQREAVARHVAAASGVIVGEFQEIESGKRNDRPQITAALAMCRARRAMLIIAKLDRLARNVAFISSLMESSLDFVACDNPHATRLTIHILAAVAEHEREMISQRTKAALAAAKARGVRLGNPRLEDARQRSLALRRHRKPATDLVSIAKGLAAQGLSLREIARRLNRLQLRTPRNKRWHGATVAKMLIDRPDPATARDAIAGGCEMPSRPQT
jgi:DNA invertase Pin-like site-specific DNA recombinase